MKQPFVNATLNDRRKALEHLAHRPSPHPLRDEPLQPLTGALPVRRTGAAVKKESPSSDIDRMKAEISKMMAAAPKKPKAVPKSKLIRMSSVEEPVAEPMKDYMDVLTMLLAKK